jgi:hypothetical protein
MYVPDRMYLLVDLHESGKLNRWFFLGVFVCSQNGSIILFVAKMALEDVGKKQEKVAITPNP